MRWRLELCHKDRAQLRDLFAVLRTKPKLLRNLEGYNVTNKTRGLHYLEDTLKWLKAEEEIVDPDHKCSQQSLELRRGRDVVLHYSMKYQAPLKKTTTNDCVQDLSRFCQKRSLENRSRNRNAQEEYSCSGVLLVTGSKTMANDSLRVLNALADMHELEPERKQKKNLFRWMDDVNLHCAFSPFLKGLEKEKEYERLALKLKTGFCKGVWLQIGSDTDQLREGLEYLSSLRHCTKQPAEQLSVYGGVFLPSKLLLAQQKFRPWNGVKLSEGYLSSVETALEITKDILQVFKTYGVTPLFESKVSKAEQLEQIDRLLVNIK